MSGPSAGSSATSCPSSVWLVLVWILLWGTWSWANALSGLLVALAVTVLLPLPAVVGGIRVRPLPLLAFLGHFLARPGAVRHPGRLAGAAPRPAAAERHRARAAADRFRPAADDHRPDAVAGPGSLVLDLDREERLIAIHLLHVRDHDHVELEKAGVLATEDRVVRAFGSAAEIAALGSDAPRQGRTTP